MNTTKKNIVLYIIFTIIGLVSLVLALTGVAVDSYREGLFWGMSGGFGITGILGIFLCVRTMKNPKKLKEADLYETEERSVFIREKVGNKVFSIMQHVLCISIILAGVLGYKDVSIAISILALIELVLYFIFISMYSKKY